MTVGYWYGEKREISDLSLLSPHFDFIHDVNGMVWIKRIKISTKFLQFITPLWGLTVEKDVNLDFPIKGLGIQVLNSETPYVDFETKPMGNGWTGSKFLLGYKQSQKTWRFFPEDQF